MRRAYRELFFELCPNCSSSAVERLKGYSFCVDCAYDEFQECEKSPRMSITDFLRL
ncbi:MAG: hypothetical protein K2X47_03060 [Bdellovibrionales bacterium]|nr:hypothetical protein [Bdellovibrionales bacterium]